MNHQKNREWEYFHIVNMLITVLSNLLNKYREILNKKEIAKVLPYCVNHPIIWVKNYKQHLKNMGKQNLASIS